MALEVLVLPSDHDFPDSPDELNKINKSIGAQVYHVQQCDKNHFLVAYFGLLEELYGMENAEMVQKFKKRTLIPTRSCSYNMSQGFRQNLCI